MRLVEDYHVDRMGVDAQQCAELTITNSSIGLDQFSCSGVERPELSTKL